MQIAIRSFVTACVLVLSCAPVFAQAPAPRGEEFPVFRSLERIAADPTETRANRLAAIEGLGNGAHPTVVPALLAMLTDPDSEIRSAAALALGWTGNQAAINPLLARATDAAEAVDVRVSAITALGRIGDPIVLGAIEGLAKDVNARVRREALLALVESPLSERADRVSAAIMLLGDIEQDGHARSRAAALLGSAKDVRALDPLIQALQDTRPPAGFSELPSPEGSTGQMKILAERLRSLHNVRAHAAWALGMLGDQKAGSPLLDALSDRDPLVRIQSAAALGRLKAPGSVAGMIQAMGDPDARVRQTVASALGMLGDPSAGPVLLRALGDQEAGVRQQAALALGRLDHQAARAALAKMAEEDPVPAVRQAARAALAHLDRPKTKTPE